MYTRVHASGINIKQRDGRQRGKGIGHSLGVRGRRETEAKTETEGRQGEVCVLNRETRRKRGRGRGINEGERD